MSHHGDFLKYALSIKRGTYESRDFEDRCVRAGHNDSGMYTKGGRERERSTKESLACYTDTGDTVWCGVSASK